MLKTLFARIKLPLYVTRTSLFTSSKLRYTSNVCYEPTCRWEAPLLDNAEALSTPEELRRKSIMQCFVSIPSDSYTDISPVNGVPKEHIVNRRVRIYKPTKNAMQEGSTNTAGWEMEFDLRQRWTHPLNSWTASSDPLGVMKVKFAHPEDAISLCNRNGWCWTLDVPRPVAPKKKNYAENFVWNKRTRVNTR